MGDKLVGEFFHEDLGTAGSLYQYAERCDSEDSLGNRGYFGCASEESQGTGVDIPVLEVIYPLVAVVDYGLRDGRCLIRFWVNKSN